jgi:SAM-dependent methyltransferase
MSTLQQDNLSKTADPAHPRGLNGHMAIEAAYFDAAMSEQGDFNPFKPAGWTRLARAFVRMAEPKRDLQLLDIGCGTGRSLQLYEPYVKEFVGIDLSQEMVRLARKNFPAHDWVRADACVLPFDDETFDGVCFSAVLHHIPNYRLALSEGRRVLKKGGFIFAFDPNLLHPAMAFFRHPRSPFYLPQGVSPNERPLLPSRLRSAFESAGLVHIRQRRHAGIPYRYVAPKLINSMLKSYNAVDAIMHYSGLGRWFGALVATMGRKPAE